MRRLLTSVCALSLITASVMPKLGWGDAASSSAQYEKNVEKNSVDSKAEATPVTTKADDDLDYSSGSGSRGTKAAYTDAAITAISGSVAAICLLQKYLRAYSINWPWTDLTSKVASYSSVSPILLEHSWFPLYLSINWYETLIQLGHAAVNEFIRQETYITASFTGAQGHVTDKWVGAPSKNKTYKILGDFSVSTQRFAAISFDPNEYKGLQDADSDDDDSKKNSARELMEYRNKYLIEEQRSLENVTSENWGLHYRAQQRSINAMATALQLKEILSALASADSRVSAEYGSKTQAVSSVAARRILYDALMYLKMNVMAVRTRTRAEALELDFKPVTTDPTKTTEKTDSGVAK